ncbi:MAG: tetratricopeptide repeat protein [Alphaproteobacteria bacterium]
MKNIARPIKAHRVHFEGGEPAEIKASETGALSKTALSRRVLPRVRWLALAAVLVLVAVAGGWYALRPSARDAGASSERTTIAVLPFTNMSGDPAQDYFSDGITEEILTALARSRTLLVTARNSSFTYKGKAADVKEVGRTLGVRYVVEGSVQKTADTVRVTAQLIDAQTGSHVWAEKFDRPLKDILAVQDEITMAIAAQLGSRVQKAEVDAILRKGQVDLGAYDYYLRGRALRQTSRKAPTLESRALFEKAIELDPKFASPYAELAFTYYLEVSLRWDPANREQAILKGVNLVETALAIDESLPFAHLTRGDLYIRQHEFDQAMVWVQQAIRLNPSDPDGYAALANIYAFLNRSGEALPLVEKAIALDPLYPPIFDMYQGRAYTLAGRFTEAIPHLQHCIGRAPDYWPCHAYLASSYAHMGNMDLAHQELAEMRRYYPVKSLRQYRDEGDFQPGPETDRVYKGLLLAGLPEE